jgi:hypothetical protein
MSTNRTPQLTASRVGGLVQRLISDIDHNRGRGLRQALRVRNVNTLGSAVEPAVAVASRSEANRPAAAVPATVASCNSVPQPAGAEGAVPEVTNRMRALHFGPTNNTDIKTVEIYWQPATCDCNANYELAAERGLVEKLSADAMLVCDHASPVMRSFPSFCFRPAVTRKQTPCARTRLVMIAFGLNSPDFFLTSVHDTSEVWNVGERLLAGKYELHECVPTRTAVRVSEIQTDCESETESNSTGHRHTLMSCATYTEGPLRILETIFDVTIYVRDGVRSLKVHIQGQQVDATIKLPSLVAFDPVPEKNSMMLSNSSGFRVGQTFSIAASNMGATLASALAVDYSKTSEVSRVVEGYKTAVQITHRDRESIVGVKWLIEERAEAGEAKFRLSTIRKRFSIKWALSDQWVRLPESKRRLSFSVEVVASADSMTCRDFSANNCARFCWAFFDSDYLVPREHTKNLYFRISMCVGLLILQWAIMHEVDLNFLVINYLKYLKCWDTQLVMISPLWYSNKEEFDASTLLKDVAAQLVQIFDEMGWSCVLYRKANAEEICLQIANRLEVTQQPHSEQGDVMMVLHAHDHSIPAKDKDTLLKNVRNASIPVAEATLAHFQTQSTRCLSSSRPPTTLSGDCPTGSVKMTARTRNDALGFFEIRYSKKTAPIKVGFIVLSRPRADSNEQCCMQQPSASLTVIYEATTTLENYHVTACNKTGCKHSGCKKSGCWLSVETKNKETIFLSLPYHGDLTLPTFNTSKFLTAVYDLIQKPYTS